MTEGKHHIRKVLVANRGEIAVRIIRAARELSIATVAVYSTTDRYALHVLMADECVPLHYRDREPYLDIEQIIEAAKLIGADAVHPGYGFLSENPEFAQAVVAAGIIFIGPSHQTIAMMGDKVAAKKMANQAGVPVVPGFEIDLSTPEQIIHQIEEEVGFPVLIKARAGGGGRGMRLVTEPLQLADQLSTARREAKEAFGSGQLFIERFIERPRHIEIQIIADAQGGCVHLFERECSIQRRHQKVIEEAPSSLLSEHLRNEMGECAVLLARACGYKNAGTVEFIMDEKKRYYFLEVNTRLQVEHPTTEMTTGIDLVKLQFSIAEGNLLPFDQKAIKMHGHTIELRVCAEDPANGFLPDIGLLKTFKVPGGPGVRLDSGYEEGMRIPVEYDPLIAKLICHGANREEAISRMLRAIDEFRIEGVQNTLAFGRFVLKDKDFRNGNFDTTFVTEKLPEFLSASTNESEAMVAALMATYLAEKPAVVAEKSARAWKGNWRNRLK